MENVQKIALEKGYVSKGDLVVMAAGSSCQTMWEVLI